MSRNIFKAHSLIGIMTELKKWLDYVVLTSDPGGDEHSNGKLEDVRKGSLAVMKITADYINKTPQIIAWLNTGDIDDLYLAAKECAKNGTPDLKLFLKGNSALYQAMDAVYKTCRLPKEQKLVVLGNHDIPLTFFQTVENCTLVGADNIALAQNYQQASKGKLVVKPTLVEIAQIGDVPVIGAMNTMERPKGIPQEWGAYVAHLSLPHSGFYDAYPEIYAEVLKGKYYLMSHKGLIDKRDAFRKQEDTIHKIAAGSLASFEAHLHEMCANKVGDTYRFRSGTNHFLVIGLEKESGKPIDVKAVPFV